MNEQLLTTLEELLSITESVKDSLAFDKRETWLRISAETADLREEFDSN